MPKKKTRNKQKKFQKRSRSSGLKFVDHKCFIAEELTSRETKGELKTHSNDEIRVPLLVTRSRGE